MKGNLPQERKDNFFSRFILKIKSWLFKCEENKNEFATDEKFENNQIKLKKDMNSLKNEYETHNANIRKQNIENKRKIFLKMLVDKPELLENFSNDRLEILLKEYQHSNEMKKMKIKKYGGKV